jgi:predicted Zn-dependent protease
MLAATRRALDARPGSPQALYLLAVMAARAGNFDLARAMLGHIGDAADDVPGVLLLGGLLDYHDGAYEQAIGQWRALLGRQPMNLNVRRLLGAALLRSGDAQGALDVLRPAALRGDADSYTLALVGRAFERTGQRDWAAKYLDRAAFPARESATAFGTDDSLTNLAGAAQQAPDDPVKAVGYLKGLVDAGNDDGALAEAQKLAAANPGAPAAWLLVGDMDMLMQRSGDAVVAYRHAANIRFDEPTMLRVVDALDRAGRRPEAANALALYLSQNPQSMAGQRLAAHWQIAAGQWDAAIDTLEGLRQRIGNRDAALLSELAFAYAGDGQADVASSYAKAAYRIAPLNPAVVDAYGWALYQAGNDEGAAQLLEKAASIAPEHSVIRWHLAQVYADMDRNPDARAQIQAALADPSFGDRDAAAALLKTLA